MTIEQAINLGFQHQQHGQLCQAEEIYRQVLALQPDHPDALHLLGSVAHQLGRYDVAIDLIGKAIRLYPAKAEYHLDLGLALASLGRSDQAIAAYRHAIALNPLLARAWNNLGNTLWREGKLTEAIAACRQALALSPNMPEAHNNLGSALLKSGEIEQAIACFRQSIALRSDHPDGHIYLGDGLHDKGDIDGSIACFQHALSLNPSSALAHWNLGLMLLFKGDFEQGWQEFGWYWQVKELDVKPVDLPRPWWDGSDLNGKRILLHADQGFGDAIHFARFIPQVAQRGGRIIIACRSALLPLLRSINCVEQALTRDQALPDFDVHYPIASLPCIFKPTQAELPAKVPYLLPDPAKTEYWKARIHSDGRRKIGLVWAGQSKPDPRRSIPVAALAPLAQIPSVELFSLQMGEGRPQTPSVPLKLTDWTSDLHDFSDTAAIIANLDLVITVDTAVAHLAGAMGKPIWTLLKNVPDWRWMLNRNDSPWYPTMRLFRQPRAGDRETPIWQVVEALKE